MAIEDIFKALEEQADQEVNHILHVATVQSDAVEHEARDEAERITSARVDAADTAVRAKATKAVNAARLQVKRDLAAVRDEAVDAVFVEAQKRLAALRGTAAYERVFKTLAEEALTGIDAECEVLVGAADEALAKKIVDGAGVKCVVVPSLDAIGGLVVSTHGGRVTRRNTFESRMLKARSLASAKIAEVLTK